MTQEKKETIYRLIGIRVMYYRNLRGWRQEELAKRAGISKSTVSKIEQGKYGDGLSISMILLLGDALKVGMDVLLVSNCHDSPVIDELLGKKTKRCGEVIHHLPHATKKKEKK